MSGELLIQVIDIGRFRSIRPALDELDAARVLGLETLAVLRQAATSPLVRGDHHRGLARLLPRILNHPELELRVFLAPAAVDGVIEGLVHALCFENGAEFSLVTSVGPSWVVLDIELAVIGDLDWFPAIFLDPNREDRLALGYPRAGFEGRYGVLSREDVARVAAGLQPLLDDPIPTEITALLKMRAEHFHLPVLTLSEAVRAAAERLARLAGKALSREGLTLAHTSLL
jgi:hypothetical protein